MRVANNLQIARNVAPSGLPTERSLLRAGMNVCPSESGCDAMDVLRRNNWVTAIPIEAKDNELA